MTQFADDPMDRLVTPTDLLGGVTRFTCDPNGTLRRVTDAKIQTAVGNEEAGSPGGEGTSRGGAGAGLLTIDRRTLRGAEDVDGDFSDAGRARVGGEERFDSLHGVGREPPGKGRGELQKGS